MGNNISQKARDRIYLCKENNGKDLNLSQCNIKRIPRRILKFKKSLKDLNVGKNNITEFYKQVEKLTGLEKLIADSNELKEICPNLSKLEFLVYLDVSNNILSSVPNNLKALTVLNISYNSIQSFGNVAIVLPALQELIYTHNKVSIFPTEILELRTLRVLNLAGNRLNYLPDEISHLAGSLEELNLSENVFTSFPTPIASLTNLRFLSLSNNNLGTLSNHFTTLSKLETIDFSGCSLTAFDFDLSQLSNLAEIYLSNNRIPQFSLTTSLSFSSLVNSLRILDLSNGCFTAIPKQIGWCRNLRRLMLAQNQITKIPGELFLLNPSSDIILTQNPLEYPLGEWIKEGIPTFLRNLKPYMKCYGPNCSVSGLEPNLKAMAPNQFNIDAFDYDNQPRISGGDEFKVQMLLNGTDDVIPDENSAYPMRNSLFFKNIECVVKDNKSTKPGTYTVYFNSPQTGTYTVNITSDNLPIKGSPFTIELS
ncbi:hypothetical protein DICPUDRAFT_50592 [Dictyostelium purpureum]|uniref:Uncharacterized protein n=1 Tax=Dictyostelium purpureum TaxID=5786 RepID=F0ZZ60_DICPU|nr:uncharacterized protein DICPUDRAFT_50592 [Dictyostelium purpureum]EGC30764.1 hypothetical protein DICPUDRAFT_50592 [Dictyostelium purpureum]|eukprot:XP_003292704.1 hypothetical protein DICPUDRAFT_50592 [Dictyostelium purpureum]